MSRREFYLWVNRCYEEQREQTADDPERWKGTDNDEWWRQAREKRNRLLGR